MTTQETGSLIGTTAEAQLVDPESIPFTKREAAVRASQIFAKLDEHFGAIYQSQQSEGQEVPQTNSVPTLPNQTIEFKVGQHIYEVFRDVQKNVPLARGEHRQSTLSLNSYHADMVITKYKINPEDIENGRSMVGQIRVHSTFEKTAQGRKNLYGNIVVKDGNADVQINNNNALKLIPKLLSSTVLLRGKQA